MAGQNIEWMIQVPLELHDSLCKMPMNVEKLLMKYDLDGEVKEEYHLDTFYLHLHTLEVCYDDIACRFFPCRLDGRAVVWYHNLHVKSI